MAISGKQALLLGVLVTAVLAVAAEGSVTVYNPAKMLVDILVNDKDVRVGSEVVTLDVTAAEQKIQFKSPTTGDVMEVNVTDGDVLVLIPDPHSNGNLALKVQVHD